MRGGPPRPGAPGVVTPGRRRSTSPTVASPNLSISSRPMTILAAVDRRRASSSAARLAVISTTCALLALEAPEAAAAAARGADAGRAGAEAERDGAEAKAPGAVAFCWDITGAAASSRSGANQRRENKKISMLLIVSARPAASLRPGRICFSSPGPSGHWRRCVVRCSLFRVQPMLPVPRRLAGLRQAYQAYQAHCWHHPCFHPGHTAQPRRCWQKSRPAARPGWQAAGEQTGQQATEQAGPSSKAFWWSAVQLEEAGQNAINLWSTS